MEKVYKTMKKTGVGNLVLGIMILLFGIAAGILMIVSGAKLLHDKKNLTF